MHTLATLLTVGVLGMVFGLAAATFGLILVGMFYAPIHEANGFLHGWRRLTCPQTRAGVDVRLRRLPASSGRRLAVINCSRFGDRPPTCRQMCVEGRAAA